MVSLEPGISRHYHFIRYFRYHTLPEHFREHSFASPGTGRTEPLSNSFQTFLAFCANNTFRSLWHWFLQWRWNHWIYTSSSHWHYESDHWEYIRASYDSLHWVPWKVFAANREYPERTRPLPTWEDTVYRDSIPIVQCPKCGLWLASAWEYSLHAPNEELPFFVHDNDADDSYDDGSICWKIQSLANWIYREEPRWPIGAYMPAFVTARLATRTQIAYKESEPYYPVVCAVCKVWVQDPGCAVLHKACPAVCWKARHTFWRRPSLSDSSHRNRHCLGLTTLTPNLRPLVFWRHAMTQIFQHKYTIVYHSHCLHKLHPVTRISHVHIAVLAFLVCPFGKHICLSDTLVQRKLAALRQILTVVQYLKHF